MAVNVLRCITLNQPTFLWTNDDGTDPPPPKKEKKSPFNFVLSKYLKADNILVRKVAFVLLFVLLLDMAKYQICLRREDDFHLWVRVERTNYNATQKQASDRRTALF